MALLQSAANYVEWETRVRSRKARISVQVSAVWFEGTDFQVINICSVLRERVWVADWIQWLACVHDFTRNKSNRARVHLSGLDKWGELITAKFSQVCCYKWSKWRFWAVSKTEVLNWLVTIGNKLLRDRSNRTSFHLKMFFSRQWKKKKANVAKVTAKYQVKVYIFGLNILHWRIN